MGNYSLEQGFQVRVDVHDQRFSLVSLDPIDCVTIEKARLFRAGQEQANYFGLVIVELKQERFYPRSTLVRALSSMGIRPSKASKYCLGVIETHPRTRANRLLPQKRRAERILNG